MTELPGIPAGAPEPGTRRLQAEWEPQSMVLLVWPHPDSDWGAQLDSVEPVYRQLAHEIASRQPVVVVTRDTAHREQVQRQLTTAAGLSPRLALVTAPYDDTWIRDSGPLSVSSPRGDLLVDYRFDGWGGKFSAVRDDALSAALHAQGLFDGLPLERHEAVFEGGALESDGAGSLLATEETVLARFKSRRRFEASLGPALGVRRFLYLQHGYLAGDDTDGHVDMLARFCAEDTIAYVHCDQPGDPHHAALSTMRDELRNLRRANGQPYRLLPLPWPRARFDPERGRLPLTYANFLIINDAVLLPQYDDPADQAAGTALASAFPGRRIVPIPSLPLIRQGGGIHCATMQISTPPGPTAKETPS